MFILTGLYRTYLGHMRIVTYPEPEILNRSNVGNRIRIRILIPLNDITPNRTCTAKRHKDKGKARMLSHAKVARCSLKTSNLPYKRKRRPKGRILNVRFATFVS